MLPGALGRDGEGEHQNRSHDPGDQLQQVADGRKSIHVPAFGSKSWKSCQRVVNKGLIRQLGRQPPSPPGAARALPSPRSPASTGSTLEFVMPAAPAGWEHRLLGKTASAKVPALAGRDGAPSEKR